MFKGTEQLKTAAYTDTRQQHFNTTGSNYMVGQGSAEHLGLKKHKIETFH
jgi:hypothetical protein